SRVCFAQSSDYSTATSIGFCSHAVYIALTPTSRGFVAFINAANDADNVIGGIRKFVNRKAVYPYVEMYLGIAGSMPAAYTFWLNTPATRQTFVTLLVSKVQEYPEMTGVYLDFVGLSSAYSAGYASLLAELKTALTARNLKLITALPWNAGMYADIYFNPTLPTLPFNVIKTHEDMYSTNTNTHPISPLFPMAAPFSDEAFRTGDLWRSNHFPNANNYNHNNNTDYNDYYNSNNHNDNYTYNDYYNANYNTDYYNTDYNYNSNNHNDYNTDYNDNNSTNNNQEKEKVRQEG
uniref:GH18 domain-containing protein n=1 Tax=Anopheles minimus TaxID=112268 RepID=A0A182W0E7_9DIPT